MFKKLYYLFLFTNIFYWGWLSDKTNMLVIAVLLLLINFFHLTWERIDIWFSYLASRIDYIENNKEEGE